MRRLVNVLLGGLITAVTVQPTMATPGDTVRSIPAPSFNAQGLTFDGNNLWCVDRRTDMIYKLDSNDGRILDSIPTPGYVPRGLTWDGRLLWTVDAEEARIYAVNPETRIVERNIFCPVSRPGDLAWDGRYLWITQLRGPEIHQISPEDGTTITSVLVPERYTTGLTFDGTYLWVADRIEDMIYMVAPDGGEVIMGFESPAKHAWGLAWDGKHLWNVDYETDRIYQIVTDDGTLFSRTKEKTQRLEFIHQTRNFGPGTVKTLDVYLSIPQDRDNQKLLSEPHYSPQPVDILTDKWGQKVAHFRFADIPASQYATVTMLVDATLYQNRYFVFPDKVGPLEDVPDEIRTKYLADDAKFSMDDPIIASGVDTAVGDETNPYWIARKIFNYLIERMEYELAGGWNIAPTVLGRGTGSCSEYSFVYIAMCRAAGLPARYVGSVVVRGDDASYDDVFHRWVEVYLPNYGWLPVDPSGGDFPEPARQANYFGFLRNRFLITTVGGGGSEYLEWGYNVNERWTSEGRCKVEVENFGEWSPLEVGE